MFSHSICQFDISYFTLQTTFEEYSKNLLILTTIEKPTMERQIVSDFLLDVSVWGLRMQLSLSTAMASMVALEPVREIWARGRSQGTRRGWIWRGNNKVEITVRVMGYCPTQQLFNGDEKHKLPLPGSVLQCRLWHGYSDNNSLSTYTFLTYKVIVSVKLQQVLTYT